MPTKTLLSQEFADSRACTIDPDHASTQARRRRRARRDRLRDGRSTTEPVDTENVSTTHLSVVDKWGNAAAYTLTIEQTGGSAMTVPGRGFLLNNELTDFTAVYDPKDPNRIEPGKRPRSSMSPTIVLKDGKVKYVVGSPGGATIRAHPPHPDRHRGRPRAPAPRRGPRPGASDADAVRPALDRAAAGAVPG